MPFFQSRVAVHGFFFFFLEKESWLLLCLNRVIALLIFGFWFPGRATLSCFLTLTWLIATT